MYSFIEKCENISNKSFIISKYLHSTTNMRRKSKDALNSNK